MENRNISWKKYLIIFIIASGTTVMYSLPYLKSTFYDPMRAALGLDHQQLGNLWRRKWALRYSTGSDETSI